VSITAYLVFILEGLKKCIHKRTSKCISGFVPHKRLSSSTVVGISQVQVTIHHALWKVVSSDLTLVVLALTIQKALLF